MTRVGRLLLAVLLVSACACNNGYVEREVGYNGRARVNPWLAAERFAQSYEFDVVSLAAWRAPQAGDAVWLVPALVLNNESFVRRAEHWANSGGHLIILLDHAAADSSDWREFEPTLELTPALPAMLRRLGIELKENAADAAAEDEVATIDFDDDEFEVAARSRASVAVGGAKPGVFASVRTGGGRVSVLTDARPLRNRWIGEHQHADFLLALIDASERDGSVVFVRSCGLSFSGMLRRHLWPVLCGLALVLVLWLWRNLSRFGPLEAALPPSPLRGYDHHLEALGNFHWRLDRAAALLAPLREQILERGLRPAARRGPPDEGFFQWLAARSGLPAERVARALAEHAPADSLAATRRVADLQFLLKTLT
ncbi:MAG: DUF4350 domain-containing protein [Verrucomicrobiota bacterium]